MTTIAAVVLLAGCGGGAGNKSAGTPSVGGSRQVVSPNGGAFRTVVPLGFTYVASAGQYYATRPPGEHGGAMVLVVLPELRLGDMKARVRRALRALRRPPSARHLSGPFALSVGGEPALAVDYLQPEEGGKEARVRQVFVGHGETVYIIREFSPPAQHAAASAALEEVLSHWQWG